MLELACGQNLLADLEPALGFLSRSGFWDNVVGEEIFAQIFLSFSVLRCIPFGAIHYRVVVDDAHRAPVVSLQLGSKLITLLERPTYGKSETTYLVQHAGASGVAEFGHTLELSKGPKNIESGAVLRRVLARLVGEILWGDSDEPHTNVNPLKRLNNYTSSRSHHDDIG